MTSDKILMKKSSYCQACTVAGGRPQNIQTKATTHRTTPPSLPKIQLFQEEYNVKYPPFNYASVVLWFNIL